MLFFLLSCGLPFGDRPEPCLPEEEPAPPDSAQTGPSQEDSPSDTPSDTGAEEALSFQGPRPQNVLIISLDTTRKDHLGPWSRRVHTPRLNQLLDESVVLAEHRSCSNWTFQSMLCIQAGMRALDTGFLPSTSPDASSWLPPGVTLMSERLSDAGWRTTLVSSNTWFSGNSNMAQGFQRIDYEKDRIAEDVTDQALIALEILLEEDSESPWYLHVHYLDPHTPYAPPEAYRQGLKDLDPIDWDLDHYTGHNSMADDYPSQDPELQALIQQHVAARYEGELAYFDDQLSRFLDGVESSGALEDSLVVFVTDHGEQHWEHGEIGHKYALYEQENQAVASLWARHLEPRFWEEPTSHHDLWPSILTALGLEIPEELTGSPLGSAPADRPRFGIRHSGDPIMHFVERDQLKLMYWWDGSKELYQLDEDPGEQQSVYDAEDPEVHALWELLLPDIQRVQELHPGYEPVSACP